MWDLEQAFHISCQMRRGVPLHLETNGPLIMASYYTPINSGDMEFGPLTPSYNDLGGYPNNAWVHMDMEVNLAADTYQLLVNNVSEGTFAYYQPTGPLESLDFYSA